MHTHVHTHTHTDTHARTRAHAHTHAHTQTHSSVTAWVEFPRLSTSQSDRLAALGSAVALNYCSMCLYLLVGTLLILSFNTRTKRPQVTMLYSSSKPDPHHSKNKDCPLQRGTLDFYVSRLISPLHEKTSNKYRGKSSHHPKPPLVSVISMWGLHGQ